jgi:hypothetical protein
MIDICICVYSSEYYNIKQEGSSGILNAYIYMNTKFKHT